MAEKIDDLTVDYSEDGKLIVKQIDKTILTRGNWTTIMFLFQDLDKKTETYGPPRVSIRRYQKRGGVFRQQSKFNISSAKQGREVAAQLLKWYPDAANQATNTDANEYEEEPHARASND